MVWMTRCKRQTPLGVGGFMVKDNVAKTNSTIIWNSITNFITKLKVHQWVKSLLQLTQLYRWNILLDECYTVLRSSQISPEELLLTLNSINPSIQFTMEYSKDQIPFLDILIKRTKTVFRWTFMINPPTPKGVCLLHPVTQTIVNEISHFV